MGKLYKCEKFEGVKIRPVKWYQFRRRYLIWKSHKDRNKFFEKHKPMSTSMTHEIDPDIQRMYDGIADAIIEHYEHKNDWIDKLNE